MKKLQKLVLVQLEQHELTNREMKQVKGGNTCSCGCCDHLPGYSGNVDNGEANCSSSLSTNCWGGPNGSYHIC